MEIVKQVTLDIIVNDSDVDAENILRNLINDAELPFAVVGTDQTDISEEYAKQGYKFDANWLCTKLGHDYTATYTDPENDICDILCNRCGLTDHFTDFKF